MRQEIGWHDKAEDGSLTTRLALDTILIQVSLLIIILHYLLIRKQEAMGEKLGSAISSFATFITGFALAFVYGWKLALVMYD